MRMPGFLLSGPRRFTLHFESMLFSDTQALSQKSTATTTAIINTRRQSIPRTPLADIPVDATGLLNPDTASQEPAFMMDTSDDPASNLLAYRGQSLNNPNNGSYDNIRRASLSSQSVFSSHLLLSRLTKFIGFPQGVAQTLHDALLGDTTPPNDAGRTPAIKLSDAPPFHPSTSAQLTIQAKNSSPSDPLHLIRLSTTGYPALPLVAHRPRVKAQTVPPKSSVL